MSDKEMRQAEKIIRELLLLADIAVGRNILGVKHNDAVDTMLKAERFLIRNKDTK